MQRYRSGTKDMSLQKTRHRLFHCFVQVLRCKNEETERGRWLDGPPILFINYVPRCSSVNRYMSEGLPECTRTCHIFNIQEGLKVKGIY